MDRIPPTRQAPRLAPPAKGPGGAAWTVLVYQDADSGLKPFILDNLKTLIAEKGDANVQVAVQIAGKGPRIERYVLRPDSDGKPVETFEGDARQASTVDDFLTWGMKTLPAAHTMVVMAGHGVAWRGVCTDGKQNKSGIPVAELRDTLAKHELDIVGFDACQMGNLEVLQTIGTAVPLVVASEDLIGEAGWPYAQVLQDMKTAPERSPKEIAETIVKRAQTDQEERQDREASNALFTLSAYDTTKVAPFVKTVDALAGAILDSAMPPSLLKYAARSAQQMNRGIDHRPDSDVRDVVGFAFGLLQLDDVEETVREKAREVMRAAETLIVAEQHAGFADQQAFGLSVCLTAEPHESWLQSSFAKQTRWPQLLERLRG